MVDRSVSLQDVLLNQISIPEQLLTTYKSFGLNEQDVIVILQLHRFLREGIAFPTPNEIAQYVTLSENQCMSIIKKLMQKGYLTIDESENEMNQLVESYNLHPFWEKLIHQSEQPIEETDGSIFLLFEQEFARMLSPFEIEMINAWLDEDQFLPSLIKAALREAVLMGKLNFKYIDRILREWQKKGVITVEQAREASKQFREHKKETTYQVADESERDTSIYFNWLEGGK